MLSLLSHNCSLETTKNANIYIAFFWSPLFGVKNGTPKNVRGYRKIVTLSEISELAFDRFLRLASPMASFQLLLLLLLLFADRSWSQGFVGFFLSVGSSGKEFFRVYRYSRLSNWKQDIVGLSLASISVFGRFFFIALFVPLSRNCLGLGFDKNAEVPDSNFEARVSTSLELTLSFPLALFVFPFFSFCSGISRFCLTRFQSILSCNFRDTCFQNSR